MLNRSLVLAGLFLVVFISGGQAWAATGEDHGTKAEARAMVKEAVSFINANGRAAALEEFDRPDGKFIKKDLYIFVYDMNGRILAHGQHPEAVGQDMLDARDSAGRKYVRERIAIAKTKGSGWQDYKFRNPISRNITHKTAFIQKYDDMIIGCGAYK
jgi:signal transduction histidine kinase